MEDKYKDYNIGIDYGTSNSCVGIFINGTVQILPNRIGERTTPSIVCFTNDKNKILVGEETLGTKIDDYKKAIYEVKRFIGLNYEEFIEEEFDKNLNYEVINQDGIPKIKVNINGVDAYYSAEEISSYIIKKMVKCAEDFVGVTIKKAIVTVPAHFRDDQKNAVRNAAKMAGIEIPRIINEPTAAALAYGIGHNLVPEIENNNNFKRINTLIKTGGEDSGEGEAPLAIERFKSKSQENAIVFDLGGGTLDITLLNIRKNPEGIIDFEVLVTDGDTHLGGSDFDNKLIDYCIDQFCRETGNKEEFVRQDKKASKRLKIKCENSKKLLSVTQETIISIDNFYGKDDLFVRVTRDQFDDLCKDLYDKIQKLMLGVLCEIGKNLNDIDEIILVGGATRMVGVRNLLKRLFGEEKVKDNLNPDEAVAFGATMEAAKMEEKDKMNFNLQDICAYKLGIATNNPDPMDKEINGDIMYSLIKKYSKIPSSYEKTFQVEIEPNQPIISVKVYEGNDKYINKNTFLGKICLDNIKATGIIDYKVKFNIDVNSQLTVIITIDSLGIKKEEVIKKITHGFMDKEKKKVKIIKTKDLQPFSILNESIISSKQKLSESCDKINKLDNLNDCCKCLEDMIENYMQFIGDNELVYEKIYTNTRELFNYYLESIKLNGKDGNNDIIEKIKHHMKNLITQVGYVEELLELFIEIQQIIELRNIFYEIFINYMELMNEQGLKKKENTKFMRYYSKLYFEREFYTCKKYIKPEDISNMSKETKLKFEKQKQINEDELKKINSFANFIEQRVKSGKFMYGGTGCTMIGKKIEEYEKNLDDFTVEQIREFLDLFQNMAESFDKKENSIGEAYCLAHIIIINYKFFKRDYNKLWPYINRLKTILFSKKNQDYDWVQQVIEIINEIEEKAENDTKQ